MTTVRSGIKISHRTDTGTRRGGVIGGPPSLKKPLISHRASPGGSPGKSSGRPTRVARKPR